VITRLSDRRIGVRGRHHRNWLDERARPACHREPGPLECVGTTDHNNENPDLK
jgi:hypothetical protein